MDPVSHTLAGAAFAQTGLKRRTALGTATLLIGANLPDVDVTAYLWGGETALAFRRGLTHGILAVLLLPVALAGLVWLWDRMVRSRRHPHSEPAIFRQLLLLSALAVISHPVLDYLNIYGIRLLAPFSGRWFYGDALFIVDPWLWLILATGCWLARSTRRWAAVSLVVAASYAVVLGASGVVARALVRDSLRRDGQPPLRVMAAPLPVTPFRRYIVLERRDGSYSIGRLDWMPRPRLDLTSLPYQTGQTNEVLTVAAASEPGRKFLIWSRFPFYLVRREGDGWRVFIGDARYTADPEGTWAATSVRVGREELSEIRDTRN